MSDKQTAKPKVIYEGPIDDLIDGPGAFADGIKAGRHEAFKEAADMLIMSPQTIRLHVGEMTAAEMRTVQAVLRWQSQVMMNKANQP